ncbi:hypothetical protein PHLCEN_2v8708 [Hermanssonia centrifuga]|uniref:BCS1 N-terminal domain-containing protein n=1 Tax=Hermanssonia centrifuga TaxID=98765 RepID=A0A2R6NSV2_9APHY|nr:hypothetical protein PHLCEN_2v8708 [Hermanssonia centrifuga]
MDAKPPAKSSDHVKRERETRSQQLMSGIPWETVTLTTLSRDRSIFPKLLSEARDMAMQNNEGKLVIHTPWGIEWKPFGLPRRKRPLKSVVLGTGISEKIQEDVEAFLKRRQWYANRGRVDLSVLIDDASPQQAKRLFTQFYGQVGDGSQGWESVDEAELEEMGERTAEVVRSKMESGQRVSMAALQGLFIRSSAKESVDRLVTLFQDQRTSG